MKTEIPMSRKHLLSKVDALAQCRNCKKIWSYDGLDALMDMKNDAPRLCSGCGEQAQLYQSLESLFVNGDA